MKKFYRLTITQEGPKADKNFINIEIEEELERFYYFLARCYRDINKAERAPTIKSAKHSIANLYDEENRKHVFIIKYDSFSDHSIISVYKWEFMGLGDEI